MGFWKTNTVVFVSVDSATGLLKKAVKVKAAVAKSSPTIGYPIDCSPPGSSVHGILPARILELSCRSLLQGIFQTQGSNLGLLHCRQILYHLSHHGRREVAKRLREAARRNADRLVIKRQVPFPDFPGSPENAKAPHSQCRPWASSLVRELDPTCRN